MTTSSILGGHVAGDRMVVGFTTSRAITTNVASSNPVLGNVLDTTLCEKVCQ